MSAEPDPSIVAAVFDTIGERPRDRPLVLGICGAQGSGKTTLAGAVEREAGARGIAAASLSIDDLYLTRAEREVLAREIHPMLRTRGVPGTHDVALGLAALAALDGNEAAHWPRFDKARDDRFPRQDWGFAPPGTQLLIFEGWCVGALPQEPEALAEPCNALEALEDPDGIWRTYANAALAGAYQTLFARLDTLVLLAAPGFEVVRDWRLQQESELRRNAGAGASGLMDEAGIGRFIQHYERLTRHILAEMPARADLVVQLAADRTPRAISRGSAA